MRKAPVVQFHSNENVKLTLKSRNRLKEFLKALFVEEGRALGRLTYVFCSDEQLLSINQEFLNHDTYTDIITFDLSDHKSAIVGEVYISLDRVRENAVTHQEDLEYELHRVIFHGALHLSGYHDSLPGEKKLMREKEDLYLSMYFPKRST